MPDCVVCGIEAGDPICAGCERDYFPRGTVRCAICAERLPASENGSLALCGRCLAHAPHFDATIAGADYAPPVDGMILALKFQARLDLGHAFGRLLAARAPKVAIDAVVPVPLSRLRLRERGFNQVEEIARSLARELGRPCLRFALQRIAERPPQQGLSLARRRANVRHAFVAPSALCLGHVVLVDDVMTSGSTLDEAAACLKRAGVGKVTNMVAARTP
jgi:ComF family protein